MAKVYLLIGSGLESQAALRAFSSARSLNACIDRCRAHEAKRPSYPDRVEDTPENDAAFDLADKKMERWRKRHPGGAGAWCYEDFGAQTLRLQD